MSFTDPLEFWDAITPFAAQHKQTYIVAHNMDYDARLLRAFSILPQIGWTPAYAILGKSCTFFTFKADKNTIALLDNMNFWQCSLARLGHDLGIEKQDVDFETCSDTELSAYCKNDVKILVKAWKYWLSFLDDHDLGDFAITTAGQAMHAFRHRFMRHKIGIHNNAKAINLERQSYRGGRCEVFRVGHFRLGPYYKLDINGLYAYVMQEFDTPSKLVKVISDVSPAYLSELLQTYHAIADVIVETDEPIYAIRVDGRNVFPTGSFRVTLTTWELIEALNKGHLRGIGRVAIYEHEPVFETFVEYFTPLRQSYKKDGEIAKSQLCKMIRNSLYGKFGQKGYEQEVIGAAPIDKVRIRRWVDLETGMECQDWTFGGIVIRQQSGGEGPDSFPAIAAHIAAAGRSVLWDYVRQAGPDNCYYADTDSLIVNSAGYKRLAGALDPLKLGYLKVEGISPDLQIEAKKEYTFAGQHKSKGIRANAEKQPDGGWKQEHFTSIKYGFTYGDLDQVLTYDVIKHNKSILTHGKIGRLGKVKPPEFLLDRDQVTEIVKPTDPTRWDWWVDLIWLDSLYSRERPDPLPEWYLQALLNEPTEPLAPLNFL